MFACSDKCKHAKDVGEKYTVFCKLYMKLICKGQPCGRREEKEKQSFPLGFSNNLIRRSKNPAPLLKPTTSAFASPFVRSRMNQVMFLVLVIDFVFTNKNILSSIFKDIQHGGAVRQK